jgi:hypothetical protein
MSCFFGEIYKSRTLCAGKSALIAYLAAIFELKKQKTTMKHAKFFLLGLSLVFLTGCIEMLEELSLNKDGSGKYEITFDMSEFFDNPMMKGMLEEAVNEGETDSPMSFTDTDTTIYLRDQPEVTGAVIQKATLHMKMSEEEGVYRMHLSFPFDDVDEIETFFQEFSALGGSEMAGPMGDGMFSPSGLFAFKKGKLSRKKAPAIDNSMLGGEEGEFMKMFLASAQYTSVYRLPGKVKKTTIKGAKVDGNTVTIEQSLLEIMEGKAAVEGDITFK